MLRLRTVRAFFCKDLEEAVRSHVIVFILIGPVLLSVFFARFFGGNDVRHPVVLVCDEGRSAFVQALRTTDLFQLQEEADWQACLASVGLGKACGAVHIPLDFDRDVREDAYPVLNLAVNEASMTQAAIFREGVRGALRRLANQDLPADVRVERLHEYSGETRLALLPVWLVFTCMGGLIMASSSLTEELESKTLAAVLMSPARLPDVLVGKTLAGFAVALVSSLAVLYLNSNAAGNNLALVVLLIGGSAVFALLGTVFGLIARSQAVANAVAPMLYMVLFVPLALADISTTMRVFSSYLPTWYLYDGISQALLNGLSLSQMPWHLCSLGVSGLVLLVAGVMKLRSTQIIS